MPSKHWSRMRGVSSIEASVLAACVLPTPASPSSSNGCGRRIAQNNAVAKPSSARYPSAASPRVSSSGEVTMSPTGMILVLPDDPPDEGDYNNDSYGDRNNSFEDRSRGDGTEIEGLRLLNWSRWRCRCGCRSLVRADGSRIAAAGAAACRISLELSAAEESVPPERAAMTVSRFDANWSTKRLATSCITPRPNLSRLAGDRQVGRDVDSGSRFVFGRQDESDVRLSGAGSPLLFCRCP